MQKINVILALTVMFLTQVLADEYVEQQEMESLEIAQPEPTAVSKVMQRFSALIEVNTHNATVKVEKSTSSGSVEVQEENFPSTSEFIKTAKFETTDLPYPEDKKIEKEIKKEVVSKKETKSSIEALEANARKTIEEETKKVEEAKANALKRISEAMSRLKEAKSKEGNPQF
jgi:hypothetical protein